MGVSQDAGLALEVANGAEEPDAILADRSAEIGREVAARDDVVALANPWAKSSSVTLLDWKRSSCFLSWVRPWKLLPPDLIVSFAAVPGAI